MVDLFLQVKPEKIQDGCVSSPLMPCFNGTVEEEKSAARSAIKEFDLDKLSSKSPFRNGGNSAEHRRCAVCKDIASGYHYGVWSCEGCKAFFKRSIQGPCDYICPATNTCTIDKHRRKSCQACRLRRCYEVGMSKGSTRRDRKPYRRKSSSISKAISSPVSQNIAENTSRTPKVEQLTISDYIQALVNLEYVPITAGMDYNMPLSEHYFMKMLANLFDRELVCLINWAKSIPDYTQLVIDDQIRLIEAGWIEVLFLNYIKHSVPMKGSKIFFAPDFVVDREQMKEAGLLELADYFFSLIKEFYCLNLTLEQFSCLKVVCFLNSTNRLFDSNMIIQRLRMTALRALRVACNNGAEGFSTRLEQLLLTLPHLKFFSMKFLAYLLRLRSLNLIPVADLLQEMLDAQEHQPAVPSTEFIQSSDSVIVYNPPTDEAQTDQFHIYSPVHSNSDENPSNGTLTSEINHIIAQAITFSSDNKQQ